MGVDLKLIPVHRLEANYAYSTTVLPLERHRGAWPIIRKLPLLRVPETFNTLLSRSEDGEQRYGNTQEDGSGNPLHMVKIEDLRTSSCRAILEEIAVENEAAFAYLDHLPAKQHVALYWC